MSYTAAFLDWGAAVSFGYLASVNVAAVQIPYFLVAMTLITGIIALWAHPHRLVQHLLTLLAVGLLARYGIVEIIRLFVATTRPYLLVGFDPLIAPVHELSFPSGHVAVLSALAFITWGVRPAAGAALLLGAVIVGIARVFAGVHWPIDILGGVIAGAIAALVLLTVLRLVPRHR